jgi:hypothetical protein
LKLHVHLFIHFVGPLYPLHQNKYTGWFIG